MLSVVLAFGASVCWGSDGFLGGLKSRRLPARTVVVSSQLAALALTLAVASVVGPEVTGYDALAFALLAGFAQALGVSAYYRGLALGAMGIVAPVSATAGLVPVAAGLAFGERPTSLQLVGILLALLGVLLASYQPGRRAVGDGRVALGVGLALIAALGFGLFYVLLDAATHDGGLLTAVIVSRTVTVLVLVAALPMDGSPILAAGGRDRRDLILVGVLAASAGLLYAAATTKGLISTVGVVVALYPVTTVVLARLLLHERVSAIQRSGATAALVGVALIAA